MKHRFYAVIFRPPTAPCLGISDLKQEFTNVSCKKLRIYSYNPPFFTNVPSQDEEPVDSHVANLVRLCIRKSTAQSNLIEIRQIVCGFGSSFSSITSRNVSVSWARQLYSLSVRHFVFGFVMFHQETPSDNVEVGVSN